MSENTDYENLKAERDAAMAQVWRLVGENVVLTEKAFIASYIGITT
ncbi:MAG: hypothetical protein ACRCUG_04130 [Yersinia sp. (in: enterobacteria)]